LLLRQVARHLGPARTEDPELRDLLLAVSAAYDAADADRARLERSIVLASQELYQRNRELEEDLRHRRRLELELRQGEKLRAVGQLAAGIAHEINTPVQFVGDSVHFVKQSFDDMNRLVDAYTGLAEALERGQVGSSELGAVRETELDIDFALLRGEIHEAFGRIDEGMQRVTEIVRAMKEFGHTDQRDVVHADLNRGLLNTLTVARNEIKYVADVELSLAELPPVPCNPGELNQVFLNLIVNAAHAISECGDARRGTIKVRTWLDHDDVFVSISDDGVGMSPDTAQRVFEPFFTTKDVGKGTGQGLPIARSIIVDKHHGDLSFTTERGAGTTFVVRLPLTPRTCRGAPASRPPLPSTQASEARGASAPES
jgi:signal transduction histidine kinase